MIGVIPVYRSKGRLTFDNGVRSTRKDDPRRNPLALIVLCRCRGDWRFGLEGEVIIYRISKVDGFTVDGLVIAARKRLWKLRIAPAALNETLHGRSSVGQVRWLRRATRGDKSQ